MSARRPRVRQPAPPARLTPALCRPRRRLAGPAARPGQPRPPQAAAPAGLTRDPQPQEPGPKALVPAGRICQETAAPKSGSPQMSEPPFVSSARGIAAGIATMVVVVAGSNFAGPFAINDRKSEGRG